MPQCPQCQREFLELPRKCPNCMAELDLLVDYVNELQDGLKQADQYTRAGELGPAVWAYLSVLEIDPDNPVAREQVSQVATAVRQFDRAAPGRRWLYKLRGEKIPGDKVAWTRWLFAGILVLILVLASFCIGFLAGSHNNGNGGDGDHPPVGPDNNTLMGKR